MRTERSQRETTRATERACLVPCASCGKPAVIERDGEPVCKDCYEASRPHKDGDPYDELGGGTGGD